MNRVRERLFIGSVEAACDSQLLKANEISHILTIMHQPITNIPADFTVKYVHAFDNVDQDILTVLRECCMFILGAIACRGGRVLVHCHAGISRSAAVVIAYVMMTEMKPLAEALNSVRTVDPLISPNEGFMEQLGIWEDMGHRINNDHYLWRQYRMKLASARPVGEDIALLYSKSPESGSSMYDTIYRCRKCSKPLFADRNSFMHVTGTGFGSSNISYMDKKYQCSSLFIEPIDWMGNLDVVEGKLSCPKCLGRVGCFNWAGAQCSCGRWVTPAFQIHKDRVDLIPATGSTAGHQGAVGCVTMAAKGTPSSD